MNAPRRRPGSAVITPRISKVCDPDLNAVTGLQSKLRKKLGPHERTVVHELPV